MDHASASAPDVPGRDLVVTLWLSPAVRQDLERLAAQRGISLPEAAGRALGTEHYLARVARRNGRILIREADGRTAQLVIR